MSWIALTEDHIRARVSRSEMEIYLEAGDQETAGVDTMAGILEQVTLLVRGKVSSWRDNLGKLGIDGTIPDECLFAAATIARDALVGSLPLDEGVSELRKEELRKAHAFLDAVAAGKVLIENADGTIPETAEIEGAYGGADLVEF